MNKERALTYSLLSHIRNTGTLAKGPIDIFIPLVKRALSKMNSDGVYKGESLLEIKKVCDELYHIDFPVPVILKILKEISQEINIEAVHLVLYNDGAFSINEYYFDDYEEVLTKQAAEIHELEDLFRQFCETSEIDIKNTDTIFKFIETNKFTLSKYISNTRISYSEDFTAEAQFIEFFKRIPQIYDRIKDIYLGSIISGFIEYNSDEAKIDIELLLDTNFIVALIDLNTPESTHTCRTLLKISQQQGYKIKVLKDTIEETTNLLQAKAAYFDTSFLQKKVKPEDVYNACDRRRLSKSDLERIADNLTKTISDLGIFVISYTEKLKHEARFTEVYKIFEKARNTKKSALHDSMAILYINKQRKTKIRNFDKVNAWFVNNSSTVEGDNIHLVNGFQPETIKADDLLNILWLSNPQVNSAIESDDLIEIGLTSVISMTLNKGLPKSQILRELDDNIHKYAKEEISDNDIIRVATRITNKQLKDIENLNKLAKDDKVEFVRRLEQEAQKQRRIEESRIKRLEKVFKDISIRTDELEKTKLNFERKAKDIDEVIKEKEDSSSKIRSLEDALLDEQNKNRRIKRERWIEVEVQKWRNKTWSELLLLSLGIITGLLYIFYHSKWDIGNAINYFITLKTNILISGLLSFILFIINGFTIKTIFYKYRNHSNIQNYIRGLKIPDDMIEINKSSIK